MTKLLANNYLSLISRIILGLIFMTAGAEKISDPESFAVAIENYRLFPVITINLIALTLPWLEFVIGLFLIFGIYVKENVFIINVLLVLFIIFVLSAFLRGLDIECGCFGTRDGQKVGIYKILENMGLLLLGLQLLFFYKPSFSILNLHRKVESS